LFDPQKRALYDEVGEKGMKWTEDPMSSMSAEPDYLLKNFLRSKKSDRVGIVLIVLFFVLILVLLPLLFNLKADGIAKGPWTALATPLWMVDILFLLFLSIPIRLALFKPPPPQGMSEDSPEYQEFISKIKLLPALFGLARFLFLIAFEILTTLKLDAFIDVPIFEVFLFLFIWEIMGVATYIAAAFSQKIEQRNEAQSNVFVSFIRMWLEIFLVLKLSGAMPVNWWLVMLPVWFIAIFGCFSGCIHFSKAQEIFKATSEISEESPINPEEFLLQNEHGNMLLKRALQNFCSCFCVLFLLVLTTYRLQHKDFSTFYIFLPLYVLAGLIFFCLCCAIMLPGNVNGAIYSRQGQNEEQQPQPSTQIFEGL